MLLFVVRLSFETLSLDTLSFDMLLSFERVSFDPLRREGGRISRRMRAGPAIQFGFMAVEELEGMQSHRPKDAETTKIVPVVGEFVSIEQQRTTFAIIRGDERTRLTCSRKTPAISYSISVSHASRPRVELGPPHHFTSLATSRSVLYELRTKRLG